eukprot:2082087-Prymnesium_polylepis.2
MRANYGGGSHRDREDEEIQLRSCPQRTAPRATPRAPGRTRIRHARLRTTAQHRHTAFVGCECEAAAGPVTVAEVEERPGVHGGLRTRPGAE